MAYLALMAGVEIVASECMKSSQAFLEGQQKIGACMHAESRQQ